MNIDAVTTPSLTRAQESAEAADVALQRTTSAAQAAPLWGEHSRQRWPPDECGPPQSSTSPVGKLVDLLAQLLQLLMQLLSGGGSGRSDKTQSLDGAGGAENTGTQQENPVDGGGGFLFKPQSESDGNLVVLMPKELTGDVAEVTLKNANGAVLEEGRFTSVANGGREHFRFSKAGGDYPDNLIVEVQLEDGSVKQYPIADPSQRYD